jgi:CheY-like chemotaxis protein
MKLLIVEDEEQLAEIRAMLLRSLDRRAQRLEVITLAGDLETALDRLPEHHAVLCDGQFPLSRNSPFIVEEWDVIRREASRSSIHFVLYTGCLRALQEARDSDTPAFAKPAPIKEIYAALTAPSAGPSADSFDSSTPSTSQLVEESKR